jgi:DNA polymerase III sliding clamp (beta) subunit (PCNA family)
MEVVFNPLYVLDVLKNIDAEQISFEFSSAVTPGMIKPVAGKDNGGDNYLAVIMPMKTA